MIFLSRLLPLGINIIKLAVNKIANERGACLSDEIEINKVGIEQML
jgi:hypothetical protein